MSYYMTIPIVRDFAKVERLFEIVSKDNLGYIAGGFGRWAASPRLEPSPIRDVDVFTSGIESYKKLRKLLTYEEKLHVKHESDISITFRTDNNEIWKDCPMINLIKPLKKNKLLTYGATLEEVLENFDFSICKVGLISETECLACDDFLHDEKKKKLRIMKMESPVACINRLCKYAAKGYKVSIPDIMMVLKEWNERGSEYHKKLFKALDKMYEPKGRGGNYGYGQAHSLGYYPGPHIDEDYSFQKAAYQGMLKDDSSVKETLEKIDENLNKMTELEEIVENDNLYELIRIG